MVESDEIKRACGVRLRVPLAKALEEEDGLVKNGRSSVCV